MALWAADQGEDVLGVYEAHESHTLEFLDSADESAMWFDMPPADRQIFTE